MSERIPRCSRVSSTCLVLFSSSKSLETIRGMLGTSSTECPLEETVSLDAVAAMAENNANRFSFLGMRLTILFSDVGGCAALPCTVPGANAAFPPGFFCFGILDAPLPVPLDSAVVLFPAIGSLP